MGAANTKEEDNSELHQDFMNLLNTGNQSDVSLNCENRIFNAHKAILSARSSVFTNLFNNLDAGNREVGITDIGSSVLEKMLQYIYSDKLSNLTVPSALQLYEAAVKYSIDSLKIKCVNFIKENLTEENACDALKLADTKGDADLKKSTISYLSEKDRKKFLVEKSFQSFSLANPKLANEVLMEFIKKI